MDENRAPSFRFFSRSLFFQCYSNFSRHRHDGLTTHVTVTPENVAVRPLAMLFPVVSPCSLVGR
jgi:hypothetical protein